MNKFILKFVVLLIILFNCVLLTNCNEDNEPDEEVFYTVNFIDGENVIYTQSVKEGEKATNYTPNTKAHHEFAGWYLGDVLYTFEESVNTDLNLSAKWNVIPFTSFSITGPETVSHNGTIKLNIKYEEFSTKADVSWSSSDVEVVDFLTTGKNYCKVRGVMPGDATIYATCTDVDGNIYKVSFKVTVLGKTYNIEYDLDEEDMALLPSDAVTSYNTGNLPVNLPILERQYYEFGGWMIPGKSGTYFALTSDEMIEGNLLLTPVWKFPRLELDYTDGDVLIEISETTQISVLSHDIDQDIINQGFVFESYNPGIATVDETGLVTGISDGYTEIYVSLKGKENIKAAIGITVNEEKGKMNEVLAYFVSIAESSNIVKTIDVVGWQFTYEYELRTSVIGYLFDELIITENIAPISNYNRPGSKYPKHYITVHDTGDVEYTAKDWSETVYNQYNEMTKSEYTASYQYVLDNKDVYHNIPDDETAYHAGDGSRMYELLSTGVYGTNEKPEITITSDGYYAIDNVKTTVLAPTYNGNILTTADINDCGIRCVIQDGQYYLGKTWFDTTYRKIGNYGGNRNSIGIETCMTKGDDIYYAWQRLAKLVAKLMDENNLTVNDVVPHHYFSGKNCPQTMREAGMWEHFLRLVQIEYDILQYLQEGYTVNFTSNNPEYVNDMGRVIKTTSLPKVVSYTITVSKDGLSDSVTLTSTIQQKPF